ncbi:MAG: phospholipid carrier-dependent glycosyltransferase [Clostridiales bacterium]|nr:phospholipid carrier-dependent glycosyltransferase [Clostridiales bacterium]
MEFTFAHVLMGITIFGILAFLAYYIHVVQPFRGTAEWIDRAVTRPRFRYSFKLYRMERRDVLPFVIILAVFTFISFFGLGDTDAPQSYHQFTKDERSVVLKLPGETTVSKMMAFTGLYTGSYTVWHSTDGADWTEIELEEEDAYPLSQKYSELFKWREVDTNGAFTASYIFIGATNSPLELGELAIYDERGELVTATGAQALFDEQETVPEEGPTYLNGMYFDEIYHGRAAMETLRGIYPYETVHPPLGKTLIAVGVSTFGMTPFGWRFMGTLFGVGMLAALYVLLKNMFGKTFVAACGTLLFGFEFMRFVQTRIATVDTYPVFFIILSYLFMYRFLTTKADRPLRETIRSLGFSGLFFGIGVATKWIVVYAGVGLLVMYILKIITDYRYYYAPANSGGYTARVVKTLAFTSLTFIVVPAIIYVVSYIPFGLGKNMGSRMLFDPEYYKMVWGVQINTFKYHSALVAEHPYSSWWYQWIVNQRPILYYLDYLDGGARSAFAAFGNPVVWWGGLVAMLVMIFRSIFYRNARALVILIGYLAQLVPWMLISRIVFAYHYFPSTVFLVLGISHMFDTIYERAALPDNREYLKLKPPDGIIPGRRKLHGKKVIIAFTAAAGVLFVLFYPVLTGVPASAEYLKNFVKWMPSWPF